MAAALAVASFSQTARADEPPPRPPLTWDPAWTHANAWDYSLAGVGLATLLTETVVLQNTTEPPRWVGPILFDSQVRSVFRANAQNVRDDAANVSWGLWFVLVGYPVVVDVPYAWARFGKDVAWDLFWQDAVALSVSGAADFALRDVIARTRPYNTDCYEHGNCNWATGPEATRAFPSGHVAETTTGTALICTQHLTMTLYGAPWDALTCASAITADATVGALRLMADDHWATDLIGGAALGVAFGWGLPTLMHLHGHAPQLHADLGGTPVVFAPVPLAFSSGGGLGLAGMF